MAGTFFVSDLHICTTDSLVAPAGKFPYGWFNDAETERFVRFLRGLGPEQCSELVLLGDIFDLWIYPIDVLPPSFAELAATWNARRVLTEIEALDPRIAVKFVNGNHDMAVTAADLAAVAGGRIEWLPQYRSRGVVAEHGHARALVNGPDPRPARERPLGYYIARIAATLSSRTPGGMPSFLKVVFRSGQDVLDLGGDTLGRLVLGACAQAAGLGDRTRIVVPGGAVELGALLDAYAPLYRDWDAAPDRNPAAEAVLAEWDPWHAVNVELVRGARLVVCGHTHGRAFAQTGGGAYLNTGTWCSGEPSFVFVEERDGGELHGSLGRWADGRALTVNTTVVR